MARRPHRRVDRLGLFYGALTIGLLVGISIWLDREGIAVTAAVQDKHDRVTVLHALTASWKRRFKIGAGFRMPDGTPMQASVDVPPARFAAFPLPSAVRP